MNVLICVLLLVGVAVPASAGALRSGSKNTAVEREIMRLAGSFSSTSKTTASVDPARQTFVRESDMVMSMSMSMSNPGSIEFDPSPEPTMAPTFEYLETLKIEAKTALTGIDCATFLADSTSMDAFVNATKYGMFTDYGNPTTIAALAATTVTIDADECEDEEADRRLTTTFRRLTASADVAWEAVIEDVQELGYADADTLFTQVDNAYTASIEGGQFLESFQAQASPDVAASVTGVVSEEIDYEVETEYAVEDDDDGGSTTDEKELEDGEVAGVVVGCIALLGMGAMGLWYSGALSKTANPVLRRNNRNFMDDGPTPPSDSYSGNRPPTYVTGADSATNPIYSTGPSRS